MTILGKNRVGLCCVLSVGLLLVANAVVLAQVSTSISGRVEDTSGANIPGATVMVTNTETGATRTTETDAAGDYLVLSLPVGRYDITINKTGFKTRVEKGLDLVVGQQAVMNLNLEVGEVQQSVTVTADLPVVNTTTAAISGLVGEEQVKDLPLNGRSFDNLITLNAGALNYTAYTATSAVGAGAGNGFSVQGRRMGENLFLMNGVEYTGESNRSTQPGGTSGQLLGIDAVREFNVLTDTYSAEYGKRPGAQVVVVTQSGSNQIHGTVFEFLRNSHLDARNFFDAPPSQLGHRIPQFQRNQFGGALGAPIRKDKAFGFVNYEGFRQRLGLSNVAVVPDNNARNGMLPCGIISPLPSGCNGTTDTTPVTVPKLAAGMLPFFALWPKANGTVLGSGLALSLSAPKQAIREDFGTVRLDQNLSPRDSLSEAYTFDDSHSANPAADPIFVGIYSVRNQVGSVQEVHIFSPEKINTFRFGYSRGAFDFNVPPAVPLSPSLSFVTGLEPGQLSIGGGIQGANGLTTVTPAGNSNDYIEGVRNLFTYTDGFQLTKGKHQIGFGVWLQRLENNRRGASNKTGGATFSSLTTFLQGTVQTFQGVPNPHEAGYRLLMGAWYVEDTIKLRSNLTLNLGLRHEFNNGLNEVNGLVGNYILDSNGIVETSPIVSKVFTENNGKWLFGPRVGLAWDVFGNGKTAVRSGFGTFYSLIDNDNYELDGAAPFNTRVSFGSNTPFLPLIPVQPGITGPPECALGVSQPCTTFAPKGILSTAKVPTVQEWNLAVEQKIAANTSLRVGYVGSHGYRELIAADLNSVHPQICTDPNGCVSGGLNKVTGLVTPGTLYVPVVTGRPNPFLSNAGIHVPSSSSSYNALQLDVIRRFSQGLQFRANYTWSKNMNIATEPGNSQSTNSAPDLMEPYNPKADWGPSSSDVTNAVSMSGSYELPIGHGKRWMSQMTGTADKLASGWQVNSIVTLLSGFPYTPLVGSDQSGNGDSNNPDRPSWNPNFQGPVTMGIPARWYNPNAFITPVSGTWGNVGRGTLRGPGLAEWDMSLFKDTSLTERTKLQFRAELFNITNRTNLSFPNLTVFSGGTINPTAGLITSTTTTSRQIQFGLKFIY